MTVTYTADCPACAATATWVAVEGIDPSVAPKYTIQCACGGA